MFPEIGDGVIATAEFSGHAAATCMDRLVSPGPLFTRTQGTTLVLANGSPRLRR